MFTYDRTINFIELKDRNSGRWLGKARDQLGITIQTYKANVGFAKFDRYFAYISNKQRPYFKAANTAIAEQFEDETGFVLKVDHIIKIQ